MKQKVEWGRELQLPYTDVATRLLFLGAVHVFVRSYDDLLLPVSSSSSAAAVVGVVAVMGLLRSILYDVDEDALGEDFALLNRQSWGCLRGP